MENEQALTSNREAENIINEAADDTTFQKMLKFKKGDWWCGEDEIPRGTFYLAHCKAWVKSWIHFVKKKVVERRDYRSPRARGRRSASVFPTTISRYGRSWTEAEATPGPCSICCRWKIRKPARCDLRRAVVRRPARRQ